jgi:hypothetical protein
MIEFLGILFTLIARSVFPALMSCGLLLTSTTTAFSKAVVESALRADFEMPGTLSI